MLDDLILIRAKSELYNGFVLFVVISKNSHLYYGLETFTSASTHAKLTKKVTENNNSSREQVSLKFVSTN